MKLLASESRDTSSEEEFCRPCLCRHRPTGKLSSSNSKFQRQQPRQHRHQSNMSLSLHWLLLLGACFLFMKAHSASHHLEDEEDSLVQSGHKTASRFSPYKTRHHHHHNHHHHFGHHRPHHSGGGGGGSSRSTDDQNEEERGPGVGRREEHSLNYIYNMDSTNNQQVPEQLPIVVSSSDNSYVSASPIIITTTTTTTTPFKTPVAVEHEPQPHQFRTIKHPHPSHSRRVLSAAGSISSNEIGTSNPSDRTVNNWAWPRLWLPQRGPIRGNSRSISSISVDSSRSEASSTPNNKLLEAGIINSGSSDISTTATTTPRHNFVLSHHQKPTKKPESLIPRFEIKLATIINTQESIEAGAGFINYTVVTNFDACLVECWITDSCDTAVYQESTIASASSSSESPFSEHNIRHLHSKTNSNSLDSFDNSVYHICFLFECVKSHEFRCQFSPHDNYVSSILMKKVTTTAAAATTTREEGEEEQNQVVELEDDSDNSNDVVVLSETGQQQQQDSGDHHVSCDPDLDNFKCLPQPADAKRKKAGCLDISKWCDGTIDCSDGRDESECPAQPTTAADYSIKAPRSVGSVGKTQPQRYTFTDHQEEVLLEPVIQSRPEQQQQQQVQQVHYSRIINSNHQHGHPINGAKLTNWHDTHVASIKIGEYEEYAKGGLNSAIIATLFGVAITAMLIMIVGHKMRSIRRRLAYKSRRRSLVPEKELFNNATLTTMPI